MVMSAVGDDLAAGAADLVAGAWAAAGATTSAPRATNASRKRVIRKPPGRDVATLYIAPAGRAGSAGQRSAGQAAHQQEDRQDHAGADRDRQHQLGARAPGAAGRRAAGPQEASEVAAETLAVGGGQALELQAEAALALRADHRRLDVHVAARA